MDSFFNIMDSSIADTSLDELWRVHLGNEFSKPYFLKLKQFLKKEKQEHDIYPSIQNVFNAFKSTPLNAVKVVVLGQDPYHGEGQAHGLSFSVPKGIKIPPSLRNIYKELATDVGFEVPIHGDLSNWANEGVLLLNSVLTVRKSDAGSHQKKGWEILTDSCIKLISDNNDGVVFLLWGNYAKQKQILINTDKHFVLTSVHPSPFSAYNGFFGCKHFSKTNNILINQDKKPINWQV
jgi:uracil-DNA glycosylase